MGVAHWQHQPQRILGNHRKSVPSERIRLFIDISRITREWATRCYGLRVYLWGEKLQQGLRLHRNHLGGVIKFRFRAEVQLIGGCSCTPRSQVAPTYNLNVPEVGGQTIEVQGYPYLHRNSEAGQPELQDKIKFRFQVIWQASEQEPPRAAMLKTCAHRFCPASRRAQLTSVFGEAFFTYYSWSSWGLWIRANWFRQLGTVHRFWADFLVIKRPKQTKGREAELVCPSEVWRISRPVDLWSHGSHDFQVKSTGERVPQAV